MSPPPPRPGPRDPMPAAADTLAVVALLAARWAERLLAGHEPPLTVTSYLALRAISAEAVPAAELARRAGVSGPAVSQLLAGLSEAGLIQRTPVPSDRRWQALALSAEGRRVFQSAQLLLRERFRELLGQLPPPETDALARTLPDVAAALSGSPPPRRPPPPPARHGPPAGPPGPPAGPGPRRRSRPSASG
ncbi:MAG TPA: MarR family transcriptional regulator [Streptosporangiaceae bacterium]